MASQRLSVDEIRETIYNLMLERALSMNKNNPNSKELVTYAIDYLCHTSFKTIRGHEVTSSNVPDEFFELYMAITYLKIGDPDYYNKLEKIVDKVSSNATFKTLIGKLLDFYKECGTKANFDEKINVDMIRDTFYNLMVEQVLINGTIKKQALEDHDGYIFCDLSSYVIVASAIASLNSGGILLHNNRIVTKYNCPEEYKALLDKLMLVRDRIKDSKLSQEELELLILSVSFNPDVIISEEKEKLKTNNLKLIITTIKDMAILISQIPNFKAVISDVIAFCLDAS